MPRKESEAVPEGNSPVPRQEEFGPDQPTLADVYRVFEEKFERQRKENKSLLDKMDELIEMRGTSQRLVSLEQPRLVMEADVQADTKTRERTKGAATPVQVMHGVSCFSNRVYPDSICSTNFGDDCIEPPALPCSRDDAVVDNSAAAPKSCPPPLEMHSPTAAGGLRPTGEASIATRTTVNHPPLRLYSTEETNSKETSTQYASYDSSFWRNYLLAAPSCRRVIETNRGKIGCSIQAVLKVVSAPACFWERGARCFVGRFTLGLDEAAAFFGDWMTGTSTCRRGIGDSFTPYVLRPIIFFLHYGSF